MKASRATFLFSAFFATCLAAVHCGGDDSNSTPPGATAGNNGSAGNNSAGPGGSNGASGSNSGMSGSNGNGGSNATAGTNGNGGRGGSAGTNGNAGSGGSGSGMNPAACPAAAAMDGDMCTIADAGRGGGLTCTYTAGTMVTTCDCAQGNRGRDGGRAPSSFDCTTRTVNPPRDGGGAAGGFNFDGGGFGADAGPCAQGTMDGDDCMTNGQICNNGAQRCVCFGQNANNRQWNCF